MTDFYSITIDKDNHQFLLTKTNEIPTTSEAAIDTLKKIEMVLEGGFQFSPQQGQNDFSKQRVQDVLRDDTQLIQQQLAKEKDVSLLTRLMRGITGQKQRIEK